MHEGVTTVYKSNVDLFFCVLGAQNENEVGAVYYMLHNDFYYTVIIVDAGWCFDYTL